MIGPIAPIIRPYLTRVSARENLRAREHACKLKMADEAPQFSSELRSMRCEQCLLNKTDGSASFLQGNFDFNYVRSE